MGLLDKLFKRKQEEKVKEKVEKPEILTFYEKYPNGLPLEVLKQIDYKNFGAMLKLEQLLPSSYDINPAVVTVYLGKSSKSVVKLTFKSKTTDDHRNLMIVGCFVSQSINSPDEYLFDSDLSMKWQEFAEITMNLLNYGYRFEL